MASIKNEIDTSAVSDEVWDRIRDIAALHTRLVPGFVLDTRLDVLERARWVSFASGLVIKEPIVTLDDEQRRLVWTAVGSLEHYNASLQVFPTASGSRIVWLVDFLPDDAASHVQGMMKQGLAAMQTALGR